MTKPSNTPDCCGQQAKWVEQTANLAYFYCTKCKNEVPVNELSHKIAGLTEWLNANPDPNFFGNSTAGKSSSPAFPPVLGPPPAPAPTPVIGNIYTYRRYGKEDIQCVDIDKNRDTVTILSLVSGLTWVISSLEWYLNVTTNPNYLTINSYILPVPANPAAIKRLYPIIGDYYKHVRYADIFKVVDVDRVRDRVTLQNLTYGMNTELDLALFDKEFVINSTACGTTNSGQSTPLKINHNQDMMDALLYAMKDYWRQS